MLRRRSLSDRLSLASRRYAVRRQPASGQILDRSVLTFCFTSLRAVLSRDLPSRGPYQTFTYRAIGVISGWLASPIVIFDKKRPSFTSTWIKSAHASSTARTSSARRLNSAGRIDGATMIGRWHIRHGLKSAAHCAGSTSVTVT